MKVIENTSKVAERIGNLEVQDFTIKANAKAFKILSQGIYSNHITPPIRELATNAWDSHVKATNDGNDPKRPFDVHLPTSLEPWFSVRDYGVGMSEEEINLIYTTYFESTKTESNDYVGCLGLGSKSPFCYTDTFTVSSTQNGRMLVYTAFLENGVPKCAKLADEETDEPDGMLVQFGVKKTDINDFVNGAKTIYNRFINRPNILNCPNFKYTEVTHDYKGDNWAIQNKDIRNGSYAVMGNIAYPINRHDLKIDHYNRTAEDNRIEAMILCGVDLTFSVGQLEIAASRESLHFDDRTIKNIKLQADEAVTELTEIVNKKFAGCKTKWEAICLWNEIFSRNAIFDHQLQTVLRKGSYTFKGEEIKTSSFYYAEAMSVNRSKQSWYDYKINKFHHARPRNRYNGDKKARKLQEHNIDVSSDVVFVENDLKVGGISRINHHINTNNDVVMYVLPEKKSDITKFLKFFGYPKKDVVMTSTLDKAPKAVRVKGNGVSVSRTVQFLTGQSTWSTKSNWSDTYIDDITDGTYYYIKTDASSPYNTIRKQTMGFSHFLNLLNGLKKIKAFDHTKKEVYGIRSYQSGRIDKLSNWIEITQFAKEKFSEYFTKVNLEQALANKVHWSDNRELISKVCSLKGIYDLKTNNRLKYLNDTFKQVDEFVSSWNESEKDLEIYNWYKNLTNGVVNIKKIEPSIKCNKLCEELFKTYPMLDYMGGFSSNAHNNKNLVDYVKKINQS
jgi:hypothetical protein